MKKQLIVFIFALIVTTAVSAYADQAAVVPILTDEVTTSFGTYRPENTVVSPAVPLYEIGAGLSNVANAGDFDLSEEAVALIEQNGFAATAGDYRQIYDVYNECLDRGIPAFVTSDACLHSYHILYDYILRVVEKEFFMDELEDILHAMIAEMNAEYEEAAEPVVKAAALEDLAYLYVALGLLDPDAEIDERVGDVVGEEIGMVTGLSSGYVPSPLFYSQDYPFVEDYSQYKPRGHYTRSEEFERYFRCMMWLGRITFSIQLPGATVQGTRESAVRGLLLCKALDNAFVNGDIYSPAGSSWTKIYEPTVFFVGEADDILHGQYLDVALGIFGRSFTRLSPDVLADQGKIDLFIGTALEQLPDPKITVKAGKGYRFMGQRFIPDSYVLDQMVEEYVRGRFMPRGLDVMAALGSKRAYDIVDSVYGDPSMYSDYDPQLEKMRNELMALPAETWASNIYYNWLYTLAPLFDEKGDGYPLFMQNEAWTDKALNTALGSWAELRHDTILYAKQSETFETAFNPPDLVKGYVEPEFEVFSRLAALADYTADGLTREGLLHPIFETRLADFAGLMRSLKTISVKELENTGLSQEDYALICNFGKKIAEITSFPPEIQGQYENDADKFMAVIADVHTDPNFNECLEVGVGHPLTIYVVAPVDGVPTLTRGGMFSYYEFKRPLSDGRLTDEEWQVLQNGAGAPEMPEWSESFRAGASTTGREAFNFYGGHIEVTAVEDEEPKALPLLTASPNPFNPATSIAFNISEDGPVRLTVHNLTGQTVAVLADEYLPAGYHTISWRPDSLASGVYIVRLTSCGLTRRVKTLYLK